MSAKKTGRVYWETRRETACADDGIPPAPPFSHRSCTSCRKSAGYVCLLPHAHSSAPPTKHLCLRCAPASEPKRGPRAGATKFSRGEASRVSNLQQHLTGSAHCGEPHYTCFSCPEAGSFVTSSDFSSHCKVDSHRRKVAGIRIQRLPDSENAPPARGRRISVALNHRRSSAASEASGAGSSGSEYFSFIDCRGTVPSRLTNPIPRLSSVFPLNLPTPYHSSLCKTKVPISPTPSLYRPPLP